MNVEQLFEDFNSKRILVVGDVMIDAYMMGKVYRVSPEAPVPIVSLSQQDERLGGAANVALNLVALGAHPIMCSVVGEDNDAKKLVNLLNTNSISDEGLVFSNQRMTTVKTRVIGNHQHLLRIDSEQTNPIASEEEMALIVKVDTLANAGLDGIIFEDYNKGVLTPKVIAAVIAIAKKHGIITTVDPKKDNFFAYQGVTLFKPNLKELKEGTNTEFDFAKDKAGFLNALAIMETKLKNEISFVTLSENGVFIRNNESEHHCLAHVRNIADVSGAGDTVISVATLCLVCHADLAQIAEFANIAGGLVCEESGVVAINKEKLLKEIKELMG